MSVNRAGSGAGPERAGRVEREDADGGTAPPPPAAEEGAPDARRTARALSGGSQVARLQAQLDDADRAREAASAPAPAAPAAPPRPAGPTAPTAPTPAAPGRVDTAAYGRIHDRLTRGLGHIAVRDSDTGAVGQELSRMSPSDFRATVGRMGRDGLLRTYVGEMPSSQRAEFLRTCERQGMVSRQTSPQPQGGGNPPQVPPLYRQDRSLPEPLRDAIHARNLEALDDYDQHYHAYSDRYIAQVEHAQSGEALRALGAPAEHVTQTGHGLPEPGLTPDDPLYARYHGDWAEHTTTDVGSSQAAWRAVDHRVHELTGRSTPGEVYLRAEASGAVEHGGVVTGGRVGGTIGSRGTREVDPRAEIGHEAGPVYAGADVGADGPGTYAGVDVRGNGVMVDSDGGVEATVAPVGEEGPRGYSIMSPERDEAGVEWEHEHGPLRGSVRAGVGVTGITPEDAHDAGATGDRSTFATPREALRGTPWGGLPAERRAELQRGGWTEAEYTRHAQARR